MMAREALVESKRDKVQKFYDRESDRYLAERYKGASCEHLSYQFRQRIVLQMLQGISGSALDLGCGPAVYTKLLAERGFHVTSADLSLEMLRKAKSLAGPDTADWLNCEIERLPFRPASANVVLAIGVLAYTERPEKALAEITRCLPAGGTLVVQCSNILSPTAFVDSLKNRLLIATGLRKRSHDFKLVKYRMGALAGQLKAAGLEVVECRRYDFRLPILEKFAPAMATRLMTLLQNPLERSGALGWTGEGFVIKTRKASGIDGVAESAKAIR